MFICLQGLKSLGKEPFNFTFCIFFFFFTITAFQKYPIANMKRRNQETVVGQKQKWIFYIFLFSLYKGFKYCKICPASNRKVSISIDNISIDFIYIYIYIFFFFSHKSWISLAAQWLRLGASIAGGPGSIPGQGTKIPHATRDGKTKCHKFLHLSIYSFLGSHRNGFSW